ncbi:EEF1A lysine methyltransferase 4-like [Clavelina lepadiformis]|uniref:Methyltransferase domain-containing protein n=1 Tax=Clavelina lepadiformis TaxID=159417 RepID=A0ABP0GRU2_CLALP
MTKCNLKYEKQAYWDERYKTEEVYDWFKSYSDFKHFIKPLVNVHDRILMLGCGNSPFSYHMYEDGFTNITNVDYSPICIESMSNRYKHCIDMKWIVMDIRQLHFKDGEFDAVIEKGTIDAMLVGQKDPWHLSDENYKCMDTILSHVSRVLSPSGKFISLTFAQPHFRKELYCRSKFGWNIETCPLNNGGGCIEYFMYVMVKNKQLSESDKQKEMEYLEKRQKWNEPHNNAVSLTYDQLYDEDFLLKMSLC